MGLIGVLSALLLAVSVVSFAGIARAAETGVWISDPDTHDTWYSNTDGTGVSTQGGDSTKNTGRIWTDKSVYSDDVQLTSTSGEPTFKIENDENAALVGLSALSSAANISGQTTINQPLDIVLVLDRSGSMDDSYLTSYEYSEAYSIRDNGTYYIQDDDGTYVQVERHNFGGWGILEDPDWGWRRADTGDRVYPKTGAQDPDDSHIQFYTRSTTGRTRIDQAMEAAVTNFIDTVADENAGKDASQQHRVSIVSYSDNASAFSTGGWRDQQYFINCTQGANATDLKDYVTGLTYSGGTEADKGFEMAQSIIDGSQNGGVGDGARSDAKKVVIFFTDGMPGSGQRVENDNAGKSVNTSREMKADGVTVYSIGVFQGADPNDLTGTGNTTHDANYFMNAVSSNYPTAQSHNTDSSRADFSDNCTLGERADGDYYFAADNAESLNDVFQSIYDDFGTGATSPIESTTNIGGENVGYLTFTDTLGSYMEVKNFKAIVFAGEEFTQVSSTNSDDGVSTTYTFQGTVSNGTDDGVVYPGDHDLSTIEITVSHGATLEQGDTVTVRIPSNLVPLRLYTANTTTVDGETTTTTSVRDAYPIRVFYTVGLKSDVMDGDNIDASKLSANYISSHIDDDGNVYFLSNAYSRGDAGTTTATFQPADTNSFYYFTEDTPIYATEDTNNPATSYTPSSTYYYQRTYYAENGLHTEWVSFTAQEGQLGQYVRFNSDSGTYYIQKGSPRLTRATEFEAAKSDNTTSTAKDAISPSWVGSDVTVSLGNNGKISYPVSGSLQISKTVDWGNTGAEHNDKDFTYTVDFGGADTTVSGNFDYVKYNAAGQPLAVDGNVQKLEDGAQPVATGQISDGGTLTLKNGERVVISGLPANTSFTVTETAADGYTASNTVEGVASQNGAIAEGTVASNDTIEVAYTNAYTVAATSLADGSIKGTKNLTGRDWKDGESFTFTLKPAASSEGAPLPEGAQDGVASVTLTNDNSNDYAEDQEVAFQFGSIQYDRVGTYVYLVQEAEGDEYGLAYSNAVYRVTVKVTDDGAGNLSASIGSIYNTFNDKGDSTGEDESQWPIAATAAFVNTFGGDDVDYANITGTKNFTDATSGSVLDINDFYFNLTAVTAGAPMPGETRTGNLGTGAIEFSDIEFGIDDVGKTYEYQITEDIPQEALDNGVRDDVAQTVTYQGMTYDMSAKKVTIAVTQDEKTGNVIATVTGNGFTFTNSYRASSITTEGVSNVLKITKQLDGAAGANGQFTFIMEAADKGTADAVTNGWVTGIDADGTSRSTTAIEKDGSQNVQFDNLTFSHPGTYTFNITEKQDAPNAAWKYDSHTYQVQFEVKDVDGQLTITAPVTTNGSATFTNTYASSMDYDSEAGGVWFSKTLNGRALTANQFNFTVTTPEDDADSAAKLAEATTVLSNEQGAPDGTAAMWKGIGNLTFDEDDAGKTFTFIVAETDEHQEGDGYTYDGQPVTVQIAVSNDGDGTMSTVTTVTKDGASTTYNSADFKTNDASTYPTASFVNSYHASAADPASVNFEKRLIGRDWKQTDSFEFTLTPNAERSTVSEDDLEAAMPQDTTAKVTGADEDKGFSFGSFIFSKAGTYAYDVAETQPAEGTDTQGVSYSTDTARVTFTVTDNGAGKLQVSAEIKGVELTDGGAGVFTNTYEPESVTLSGADNLSVTKNLVGREWEEEDSFAFELSGADDFTDQAIGKSVILPDNANGIEITSNSQGHKESFGDIVFNAAGRYSFAIREVVPENADPNMYYAEDYKVVVVEVTDNMKGELSATVVEGANPTFTNVYTPQTTDQDNSISLYGKKVLEGGELTKGQFYFDVTPVDGAPMGKTYAQGNANGVGSDNLPVSRIELLRDITYTASDMDGQNAKNFQYIITEEIPSEENRIPGLTYDTTAFLVTINVQFDEEKNEYIPSIDSIEKGSYDDSVFTPVGEDATVNEVVFTNSFNLDKAVQTPLEITKVLEGDRSTPLQQGEFSFELSILSIGALDGVSEPPVNGVTLPSPTVMSNDANGKVQFGKIIFTEPGVYTLQIKEVVPAENEEAFDEHMTYSGNVFTSTYRVEDIDQDGILESVLVNTTGDTTFVNTYDSNGENDATLDGATYLDVTKQLVGRNWTSEDEFVFTLTAHGYATQSAIDNGSILLPDNADSLTITDEDEAHSNYFGNITFKSEGTYYFDVAEQAGSDIDLTYDTTPRLVVVNVERGDDGQLVASVDKDSSANLTFTNVYEEGTKVQVEAADFGLKKVFTGKEWDGDAFTFEIAPVNAEAPDGTSILIPTPGTNRVTVTGPDAGQSDEATFGFGPITYTQAGTYEYEVREVHGDNEAITYSDNVAKVTVTVSENEDGSLVASVNVNSGVFTNTYEAEYVTVGDDEENLKVTKTVTGAAAPSEFEFKLSLASGDPTGILGWPDDGWTVSTNDLKGKQGSETVEFGDFTFTKAGTYTFTVTEITTTTDGNWDYDNEPKTITVTVTDNNGQLEATVEGNNPTITNTYNGGGGGTVEPEPEPEEPTPSEPSDPTDSDTDISKTLTGRDLTAGEFTFQIATAKDYGEDVSPKSLTATNAADGGVSFGKGFTFYKEGTYEFVISEVLPADDDPDTEGIQHDGVTYDQTTHRATATVTEVDGKLQVTWSVDDSIVFTNDYEEPEQPVEPEEPETPEEPTTPTTPEESEQPKDELPGTGDTAPATIAAVAGIGIVCIAGAVILRKRGEK
ncbi:FctA domain-containing protein [Collinsella sp. An2]|uniref:Spy0128 family protein n=1 Tax=Collinsella sp. An2 TaxID=1965585 RepID=UPI000B36BFAB|nr:FctA domain-containing protein [Collinsella sp. An2]OUP10413.1 hypothetical protein B5F33_02215 [Collinsella sp. An2]